MKSQKALKRFIFWTVTAIVANICIFIIWGKELALQFFGGYIIELSLSVDNLFLFLMIFTTFGIPVQYQKRVLTYGIIGAMILRFIFIFVGISMINRFHFIIYLFSIVLILSGIKMLIGSEEVHDYSENGLIKILKKIIPVTSTVENEKFFIRKDNLLYATPLFVILILIESSDIIFALDSIPAIFSITTNVFIAYSSNIFAIIGLRSLYFLLSKLNTMFKGLKYGVGLVLMFTGVKLLLLYFNIVISVVVSLLIIMIILLFSILFSLIFE